LKAYSRLFDPKVLDAVKVDPVLGTIVWPNGADLDPDVLYAIVTGHPIPDLPLRPADTRTG
jgi:hypothetical protein